MRINNHLVHPRSTCFAARTAHPTRIHTTRTQISTSRRVRRAHQKSSGLTYIEVLISTVLILIVLVPALESIYSGIQGSDIHAAQVQNHNRLLAKMEQTLANPFADLLTAADAVASSTILIPEPYSDAASTASRRLVYLARYDGDNADTDNDPFTGTDEGLLWLKVTIENSYQSLETLIHE